MDEHTNQGPETDSSQVSPKQQQGQQNITEQPPLGQQNSQEQPPLGQQNASEQSSPGQQNPQEQSQFQQYLTREQTGEKTERPYQQAEQQPPYQQAGQQNSYQQSPYQQNGQQNQYEQTGQQNLYGQNPYQQNGQQNSYQQVPYQQPYQQNSYQQVPPKQSNGMALASMIVGIFALLTCCIPFVQFPLAVISIVLVILSKKGRPFHGLAIAGLVMAIISVLVSIGMTFYWGYVLKLMNDPEFMEMYNEIMEMYP